MYPEGIRTSGLDLRRAVGQLGETSCIEQLRPPDHLQKSRRSVVADHRVRVNVCGNLGCVQVGGIELQSNIKARKARREMREAQVIDSQYQATVSLVFRIGACRRRRGHELRRI